MTKFGFGCVGGIAAWQDAADDFTDDFVDDLTEDFADNPTETPADGRAWSAEADRCN